MSLNSPFFDSIRRKIRDLGGMHNAHLHLDRSGTLCPDEADATSFPSAMDEVHLSLPEKHRLFANIHDSEAFDSANLKRRVNYFLDAMVAAGTRTADTLVDVTNDRVGLSTLEIMLEIKERRRDEIQLNLGSYTPMGFVDTEPERWRLFETGAHMADFIGSLPERDEKQLYPDHIGFAEHCHRILELAIDLNKPVQIHLDQHNDPRENETEVFLEVIRKTGLPVSTGKEPVVWIVHFISPSLYEEKRFNHLADALAAHNIGVICCPSAALSMRQLRPIFSPTSNSIARVFELLSQGVSVRLGSDNIADICSPAGTPDLLDEVFVLCNALRFYNTDVLAKLAAGVSMTENERELISRHLANDRHQVENVTLVPKPATGAIR